jgi:hypothetical protein
VALVEEMVAAADMASQTTATRKLRFSNGTFVTGVRLSLLLECA